MQAREEDLGFPGVITPGLIEARPPVPVCRTGHPFPGVITPGLIEAIQLPVLNTVVTPFPGVITPGLIEASGSGSIPARNAYFRE